MHLDLEHSSTCTEKYAHVSDGQISKNSHIFSAEGRHQLIPYLTLRQLLNRGNKTTNDWSLSNQFEEKQNDTADILYVEDNNFVIIDVKTFNMDKLGQLVPGSKLTFAPLDIETARLTLISHEAEFLAIEPELAEL